MAKFCGFCGKENTDDAKFCISCGNPFDNVVADSQQQTKAEQPAVDKKEQENRGAEAAPQPNQSGVTGVAGSKQASVHFNVKPSRYQWFDFQNPIALIMYIIAGLTLIAGFIIGIVYGVNQYNIYNYSDYYTGFSFATMFWYWLKSFVVAAFFVAVGEIINVLQKILNKRERQEK